MSLLKIVGYILLKCKQFVNIKYAIKTLSVDKVLLKGVNKCVHWTHLFRAYCTYVMNRSRAKDNPTMWQNAGKRWNKFPLLMELKKHKWMLHKQKMNCVHISRELEFVPSKIAAPRLLCLTQCMYFPENRQDNIWRQSWHDEWYTIQGHMITRSCDFPWGCRGKDARISSTQCKVRVTKRLWGNAMLDVYRKLNVLLQ